MQRFVLYAALWIAAALPISLLSAPGIASAEPVSPVSGGLAGQLAKSAWLLNWQREQLAGGTPSFAIGEWRPVAPTATRTTPAGLLPLSLQLSARSRLNFAYAIAGADQASRDPIRTDVQGFGLNANFGSVSSESQLYFSRPHLDGGAAATLVHDLGRRTGAEGIDPSRLRDGRAVRQGVSYQTGSTKITGRFQDVDRSFALPQRLLAAGDGGDAAKLLGELAQQSGTRRTSLGVATGLSKSWSLTGGVDALSDGAGRIRRQELGITGSVLKLNSLRQEVGLGFAGFERFADPQVQSLAAQKGVRRSALQWALTPTKGIGLEGSLDTSRDAGGVADARSLAFHLGALQATEKRRSVAGFQTFGALTAENQALQKLGSGSLRETTAALALSGKSRFAFTGASASGTGGGYKDESYGFESRTFRAGARFRDMDTGFAGAPGLAALDPKYAGVEQLRGQREEGYDLDYVGSSWLGLRNHYGRIRGEDPAGTDDWTRRVWSNAVDVNLGRTTAQVSRLQADTGRQSGAEARHRIERYLLRRAVQKDGFLLAEHTQQSDRDAAGERRVLQTSRLQTKLQVASLFGMEGSRVERHGTGIASEHEDTLQLSRQLGGVGIGWSYRDRHDAAGTEDVQKLALGGELRKGLQIVGSRETRLTQTASAGGVSVTRSEHASDTRCALTQALGNGGKATFSYAQIVAADTLAAREYAGRVETPIGRLLLTTDFAQRQAAGTPMRVSQGFTLADAGKDRRLAWGVQYRHRSEAYGVEKETKGWNLSYNGAGALPLKLSVFHLRNAEDKEGKVLPGTQSYIQASTGVSRRITVGASYGNTVDDRARKADERFEVSLTGAVGKDEKLSTILATQRLFEPEGEGRKRTRVETVRLEYSHALTETQAFTIGADLNWRATRGAAPAYGCEYRSDVKWESRW